MAAKGLCLTLFDAQGRKVREVYDQQQMEVRGLPQGTHYLCAEQSGKILGTEQLLKH